jgi:hypothetical protein
MSNRSFEYLDCRCHVTRQKMRLSANSDKQLYKTESTTFMLALYSEPWKYLYILTFILFHDSCAMDKRSALIPQHYVNSIYLGAHVLITHPTLYF